MTDEKWEEQVMKKIRFMTNYIWDGINLSDIEAFLTNFGRDRVVGLVLLDMLIYYSDEQVQFIIENLIRLFNRHLWISDQIADKAGSMEVINEKLTKLYNKTCFVPVKDQGPSDSAYSLSTMYKKSNSLPKTVKFIDVDDIPLMITLKNKFFVFYDDIMGTGTQFKNFWSQTYHFGKNGVTLEKISKLNPDIKFYYLVIGGYKESITALEKQFPNIKIIASEVFSDDYSVFSENNEYWEFNSDKREMVMNFIREKERELKSKSSFSLNLPVLFQHSRASNTALSLYWFGKQNKWKELYRR